MQRNLLLFFSFFLGCLLNAVAQDEVLFTVGDTKVNKSEFEYIYKKNNFNNKADYSRKSLEDYLNLYVNFRLKVKQALEEGLDKSERFKEELGTYEKQLLDSYVDKDILEKLVKQEYERGKTDVNVSHIFFSSANGQEASALKKANEALQKIKSGASFEEVAKTSEDKQTAGKGGRIGWVNSFQIAFPEIEETVYAMKTGEVSAPIKTRLGYHIVKLNESRPARPKLKAAIIKRFFPIADTSAAAKKLVEDSIMLAYAKLKSMPFDKVVERYSEDDATRSSGGVLDWFGINTYAKAFEDVVYGLKDGEYSAPFKTSTAWYIVKRTETSKLQSYEDAVPILKVKLQNLPQYQYELDKFIVKLNEKLSVKHYPENYDDFKKRLIAISATTPFTYRDTTSPKVLLQIGNKTYNENVFGKQIQETFYTVYPKPGMDKYDALIKNADQAFVMEYYKEQIRLNNPEYKALMEEYKNGIMIFSLSEKYIWNRASEDSAGLLKYYNEHKADFNLKKRGTLRTVFANTLKQASAIYVYLQAHAEVADEMVISKLKEMSIAEPKVISQMIEEGKSKTPVTMEYISKPEADGDQFRVDQLYNILPEKPRAFDECRGYVVAAYQENLEKKWIDELKRKYAVNINNAVFEKLVKI
jgi:peptidyl-prolyl cis-trans isomerase SurA